MKNNLCPRCGSNDLAENEVRNALSRRRKGVYICIACGTEEAMRDFTGMPPLRDEYWADVRKKISS